MLNFLECKENGISTGLGIQESAEGVKRLQLVTATAFSKLTFSLSL